MDENIQLPPVQGSFEMQDKDFAAYTRQLKRRLSARIALGFFWFVAIGSFALEFYLVRTGQAEGYSYIVLPGIMIFLLYVILPFYRRRYHRKTSLWGQKMRFSADASAISVQYGKDSGMRTSWSDFRNKEQTASHFFLWYDSRRALIIPKRGFAHDEDTARFWHLSAGTREN